MLGRLGISLLLVATSAFGQTPGRVVDGCIKDVSERTESHPDAVYSWPQTWPDTSAGTRKKGRVYGQALTTAMTVLVVTEDGAAHVYHDGEHAYTIDRPSPAFWQRVGLFDLPGKDEYRVGFELEGRLRIEE